MNHHSASAASTSVSDPMQMCIDLCQECHDTCLQTIRHCLTMGGDHAAPDHIGLMLDCAAICLTDAEFMMRSSPLHHEVCAACAAACALPASPSSSIGVGIGCWCRKEQGAAWGGLPL